MKTIKKTKEKKSTKRTLVCANGADCFWTTDGKVLSNLAELRDALKSMSDEVYAYHVTKEKNDFANWIHDVLADAELAASIRTARKPKTARTVVVRRLKVYEL